jgi:[CysO sulfur-carrier protein]-S-L-cysteine hydrolase
MRPFFLLAIPNCIREEMLAHGRSEYPLECCGLLAGRIEEGSGIVEARFPIRNDLASPTEYLTNPRDLLAATRTIRETGLTELAIYHSHPASGPVPSRTDLERNTWGETVAHVIIGKGEIRGWWLGEGDYEEMQIVNTNPR